MKKIKWHPYKVQVIQKLSVEDLAKRSQFAQEELTRIENNSMHLTNLMFSDEAHFHLDLLESPSHNYCALGLLEYYCTLDFFFSGESHFGVFCIPPV